MFNTGLHPRRLISLVILLRFITPTPPQMTALTKPGRPCQTRSVLIAILPPGAFAPFFLPPYHYETSLPQHHDRKMVSGLSWSLPPSRLYPLPNEVLLHIASFLPLSSQLALSITCQHFRRLFHERLGLSVMLVFRTLFPSCKSGSWDVRPFTHHYLGHERKIYLSLVERLDTSTLWCSYCTRHHSKSSFTLRMQQTQRHLRRCRNAEAVIWICPHRSIDHETMQSARTGIAQDSLYCDGSHSVQTSPEGVQIERQIRYLHNGETTVPYTQLKRLMKARDVHVCPHLLFSSKQVYKAAKTPFSPLFTLSPLRCLKEHVRTALLTSKKQLEQLGRSPGSRSSIPTDSSTCQECRTYWHWTLNQQDVLSLIINRPFANADAVDDPQWISQTVPPEQVEVLEKEWKDDIDAFEVLVEEYALQDAQDRDITAGRGFSSEGFRRAHRHQGYSSLGT